MFIFVTFLPCCMECMRSSDENSVCPSVKCMDCDKMEERSIKIFIPYHLA